MCVEKIATTNQCIAWPFILYYNKGVQKYVSLTPEEKEWLKAHIEAEFGEFIGWREIPDGLIPGSRTEIDVGGMYSFED